MNQVPGFDIQFLDQRTKSIFNIYPQLENGEWIRMDIHRRDNLTPVRFKAIVGSIKKLVKKGYKVNFVEMSATRTALDHYKLRNVLEKLKKNKNFLFTNVWPEYANVIEFYNSNNCFAALTDSGGVQEEMNLLKKPCLTCRFNTDRPETVNDAKCNLLVPPISDSFIVKMVDYVYKNEPLKQQMANSKDLYGENVGEKFIKVVLQLIKNKERPFKWAHEALGLWREKDKGIEYL